MARSSSRFSAAGAEVVLASVDPPEVQLAMNRTWHLPFRWASDPDGERLAKPLGAWDADASIFRPLVVVLAPDGREVFRELSRDFTDRTDDEPVLAAVEALQLPALPEPAPWAPAGVTPRPSERAFQPRSFIPYFRAIRFNTMALSQRMVDDRDRDQLVTEQRMAESFLAAFDDWRAEHPPERQGQS
ncbi:peroxiredoxin family protein [Modestobacter sp. SYSU DS0985]